MANNRMHSGSKKRRSFVAMLVAAADDRQADRGSNAHGNGSRHAEVTHALPQPALGYKIGGGSAHPRGSHPPAKAVKRPETEQEKNHTHPLVGERIDGKHGETYREEQSAAQHIKPPT